MITKIDLKHFKCFNVLHLPLSPLTLLAGGNASGKSSILQAFVLLHQTIREHEWSTRLMLNGADIRMGTVTDVVDKVNGRFTFDIGLQDAEQNILWTFSGERADMSMEVEQIAINDSIIEKPSPLRFLLPTQQGELSISLSSRLRGLTYISAERQGPREFYTLEDRQSASVVGTRGEYTASVLHQGRDENVIEELALPGIPRTRLRQVEERMTKFFPGCSLALEKVPNQNAVTLGIRTASDTDFHRPIHVGFGLTQVLPILVAALSANKEDILLIENPEVHLHPAGQALMGQFLALVASAGVQVIVETHSDHILNGIRRAVRANKIKASAVALYFFRPRTAGLDQVTNPQIDQLGNIDTWPDGFFDQFDKDANHFAGWGD